MVKTTPVDFDPFAGEELAKTVPTTEAQKEIWASVQMGKEANCAYNESVTLRLQGPLHIEAFKGAIQALIDRHEALRSTLARDGGTLCIASAATPDLVIYDLSEMEKIQQDAAISDHLRQVVAIPFDLEKGPLFRVRLLKTSNEEHLVIITAHHIIFDGWSWGVLLPELGKLYGAKQRGQEIFLRQAAQFSDYARMPGQQVWEDKYLAAEKYWLAVFADSVPVLDLPVDRARPSIKRYNSARLDRTINALLFEKLKELGKKLGCSLVTLLLAAFKVYLFRITGQNDLVVGVPAAGQLATGKLDLIGHCVNLLPIRTSLNADCKFTEYLKKERANILDAYEHQEYTYGSLVSKLKLPRDPGRNPLVSVLFNLDKGMESSQLNFEGIQAEIKTNPRCFENFEIFINAVEYKHQLVIECQYGSDLFEQTTIELRLEEFETLLQSVVNNPEEHLSRLPILPPWEKQRVLVQWNDTTRDYDRALCLHEAFQNQTLKTPGNIAVYHENEHLSYDELNRKANQIAHRLQSLGVGTEVPVGVFLDRTPFLIQGILGVLKSGGAYIPIDPQYPKGRVEYLLEDANAPVILTEKKYRTKFSGLSAKVLLIDDDQGAEASNPYSATRPDNLAYILYTSGSTGKPKGVAIEHRGPMALISWAHSVFSQAELSGVLASTSICFDLSIFEIFAPLTCGGKIILAENALALPQLPAANKVRLVNTVPSAMAELLRMNGVPETVTTINLAGELLTCALVNKIYELPFIERVYDLYGPSEATTYATFALRHPDGPQVIGRPIANTQAYILDEHKQPVPIGIIGELYLGGEGLARGYYNRPQLTKEVFLANHFEQNQGRIYKTGDLARFLTDGTIAYLGRNDHQVKIRGFRIELGEIETVLGEHPEIEQCAVRAYSPATEDVRLAAYYVQAAGGHAISSQQLRAHLKEKLPEYMVPQHFIAMAAMPLTPTGKINRNALPCPDNISRRQQSAYVPPQTATESAVTAIWEEIIGCGRIGIHDNFFDLGGHSLLATRIISRIRKQLHVNLSLPQLFQAPTIAQFARLLNQIEGREAAPDQMIPPRGRTEKPILSVAQQRLWFLEQLDSQNSAYNLPAAWQLAGPLNVHAFKKSLQQIIDRHESLRTCVMMEDDLPVQSIAPTFKYDLPIIDVLESDSAPGAVLDFMLEESKKPFNIRTLPLFRACLIRQSQIKFMLFFMPHHLIWDGWSFDVFLHELTSFYHAHTTGQYAQLPELAIQYADYAVWHRNWLKCREVSRQIEYWRKQLQGELPVLQMPVDYPRPAEMRYHGSAEGILIPAKLVSQLRALGHKHDTTLFMVLLAVFQTLLLRYTGQDDIIVGLPIWGRQRPELENLIGFFVNTLVLRTRIPSGCSFQDLLAQVKEVCLNAYNNQDVPFERLVEELQPARDLSRTPIFQVMFSYQDARKRETHMGDVSIAQVNVHSNATPTDLVFWTKEEPAGELTVALNYSTELYKPSTMKRLLGNAIVLMNAIVADPCQLVSTINFLTEEEKTQIFKKWNVTAALPLNNGCVHCLIEKQAEQTPELIALEFADRRMTYRELDLLSNQLARYLQKLGAGSGTLVGICLERSVEMVIGLLGILKAGAAYVPLDPEYPEERLAYLAADSRFSVLIAQQGTRQKLPEIKRDIVLLDNDWPQISQEEQGRVFSGVSPDDLAYIIYTSGSTGKPKGVKVPHSCVVNLLQSMSREPGLTAADTLLAVTTLSFDIAALELLLPLTVGARTIIASSSAAADGGQLRKMLETGGVTVMQATPSTWRLLLTAGWKGANNLKILCGGEALPRDLAAELITRAESVWNMYGPTETTIWSTCCKLTSIQDNKPVLIGRPIANTQLYILDPNMQPVPVGVPGELHIGGLGVTKGYLNRLELSAEKFIPNPFDNHETTLYKTGDLVKYHEDGNVEYLDRLDNQVKIRGFRIELGEVESVLAKHPAVRHCVASVWKQSTGDIRLVAYIMPVADQNITATELRKFLRNELPGYMIPQHFVEIDAIPLTPAGKINRKRLPSPLNLGHEAENASAAPETATERLIAEIWHDLLEVDRIGLHDNFFDLGGHSLLSMQVISQVRKKINRVELSPRDILLNTLRQLAEICDQKSREISAVANSPKRGILQKIKSAIGMSAN